MHIWAMGQLRILVLEDDPIIALHMATVLEDLHFSVVAADQPAAALNRLEMDRPDAVVLNYCFGRERRNQAKELLQAIHLRRLPVLWVTGARDTEMGPAVQELSRYPVLYKPFTRRQIHAQLQRLCRLPHGG